VILTVFPEVLHKPNSYILEGTSGFSQVIKSLDYSWGPGNGLILLMLWWMAWTRQLLCTNGLLGWFLLLNKPVAVREDAMFSENTEKDVDNKEW